MIYKDDGPKAWKFCLSLLRRRFHFLGYLFISREVRYRAVWIGCLTVKLWKTFSRSITIVVLVSSAIFGALAKKTTGERRKQGSAKSSGLCSCLDFEMVEVFGLVEERLIEWMWLLRPSMNVLREKPICVFEDHFKTGLNMMKINPLPHMRAHFGTFGVLRFQKLCGYENFMKY